jgi:uncharacterized damage-inducible protein DinB
MSVNLDLDDLLEYTEWERGLWYDWLRQQGDHILAIKIGPHGDGRMDTVGDLVRHIFSAEKRYVERLTDRSLTDIGAVRSDNVEALFEFGRESRRDLREFLATFPSQRWDEPMEFKIVNNVIRASPRKIVVHVVLHEIRHWPQVATLFRLNGLVGGFRDFLFSPVMSAGSRRQESA